MITNTETGILCNVRLQIEYYLRQLGIESAASVACKSVSEEAY